VDMHPNLLCFGVNAISPVRAACRGVDFCLELEVEGMCALLPPPEPRAPLVRRCNREQPGLIG